MENGVRSQSPNPDRRQEPADQALMAPQVLHSSGCWIRARERARLTPPPLPVQTLGREATAVRAEGERRALRGFVPACV